MTIFNQDEDVPRLMADRLLKLAATYSQDTDPPDEEYVWEKLLAAESELEERFHVFFAPREVLPTGADPSEFEAYAKMCPPVETYEEPGYDYEPGLFSGDTWGLIELRHKPLIAVHSVVFAYPSVNNQLFSVPKDWIRFDKKYARLNLVPATDTSVNLPANAYILQALGGGRTIPLMIQVRYRAGFVDIKRERRDVVEKVKRFAVLSIIDDWYVPQSGSLSADGLSQSSSFDVGKFHETLEADLVKMKDTLNGILMMPM